MKSSWPNLHEIQDKGPMSRDRTGAGASVKLSCSQPMDPWTEWQHTHMLLPISMEPWTMTKKALH